MVLCPAQFDSGCKSLSLHRENPEEHAQPEGSQCVSDTPKERSPVSFHPIVEKLAPTGASRELRILRGYLGPGSNATTVRVYSDLALTHFVEVPESAIHHVEPLGATKFSPSWVWVEATASVETKPRAVRSLDSLMAGRIATKYLPRAARFRSPAVAGAQPLESDINFCQTQTDVWCCPGPNTGPLDCPTVGCPGGEAINPMMATWGQSCETCGDTNPLCCITVTEGC